MARRKQKTEKSSAVTDDELNAIYEAIRTTRAAMMRILDPFAERAAIGQRGIPTLGAISRGTKQPGPLAAAALVSPSLMTLDLQRLAEAGLVVRVQESHDARRARMELTLKGKKLHDEAVEVLRAAMIGILQDFPEKERRVFLKIFQRLRDVGSQGSVRRMNGRANKSPRNTAQVAKRRSLSKD